MQPGEVPTQAKKDYACKLLRAEYDELCKDVAHLERIYRDLGLKFYLLPANFREEYFGNDLEDAKRVFLGAEGEQTRAASCLNASRNRLEQIKRHFHRLDIHGRFDAELELASTELTTATNDYHLANVIIACVLNKMGGSGGRVIFDFALRIEGAGLSRSEDDERYANFRRWALTVREVQNRIFLGASEDQAIKGLNIEYVKREDALLPDRPVDDVFDDESVGSGYDSDNSVSTVTNPYEYPNDGFNFGNDGRLIMTEPAIQLR